jgi:ABC-type molybdate transport system substrate-binding protein
MMRARRCGRGFVRQAWLASLVSLSLLIVLGTLLWSPWNQPGIAGGKTLMLYCAAGVGAPVEEILRDYRERYGVTVGLTTDGTGALLSSIRAAKGRGDLFLSAERDRLLEAQKEGLVAETIPLGSLRPVLIVNRDSQAALRQAGKPVTGVRDLLREDLTVVLAEQSASIGRMTRRILEPLGLWAKLQEQQRGSSARVSTQGTVNKVALAVRTRQNSIGIVWDATARQHPQLQTVEAPEFDGFSDELALGVLTRSADPTAALQLARYLAAADRGLPVFARHHYEVVPDGDQWSERPEITLFAGAMLKPGIDDVVKAFAQREGVTINTTYDGCGVLVSDMKIARAGGKTSRGFPDAYFSCDVSFMDMVQDWFGTSTVISRNDMVLIVHKGNPRGVRSLADLARKELRIGLGDPKNSALGELTDKLLRKLGLWDSVYAADWRGRIVHTNAGHDLVNKMRAAAGSLDAAVVYRSNAVSNPENPAQYIDVVELNIPEAIATQPFAVARDSRHRHLMKRLLAALLAQSTEDRFKSLGFHWVYERK